LATRSMTTMAVRGVTADDVQVLAEDGTEESPHVVDSAEPAEHVERAERVPVREAEAAHDEVEERDIGVRERGRRGRGGDEAVLGVGIGRDEAIACGRGGEGLGRRGRQRRLVLAGLVGDVLEEPRRWFGRHFSRGRRRFGRFWHRRRGTEPWSHRKGKSSLVSMGHCRG
jgi:hypothetical protein